MIVFDITSPTVFTGKIPPEYDLSVGPWFFGPYLPSENTRRYEKVGSPFNRGFASFEEAQAAARGWALEEGLVEPS